MQAKILALSKTKILSLIYFTGLLAVSLVAPLFHFQPITGPIVNACLFIAVSILGVQAGIMLGLLPSLIALSVGTLPAPLAPMVPFIMASNAIMVVVFSYLKNKNFAVGIITASLLKFLFLFSTSYVVVNLITQKSIAQKATQMMSWPQLITALLGGLIAFLIFKTTKKDAKVTK